MWTFWICDTRTGARQLQVYPTQDGTFSRLLNAGGYGKNSFLLTDQDGRATPMRDKELTTLWIRTLVRCWNDVPIYAGLIEAREFDWDTHLLTIEHTDVRTLFTARYPFGVSSYWADEPNHIPGQLDIVGKSLRSAAGIIVQAGLTGPFATYSMPIVLPSLVEAGLFTETFFNYHFSTVADLLDDIQNMNGGPDIDFEPRWSASGSLEWLMRVGSTAAPSISRSLFEFNMSAEERRLTGVKVREDGSSQITGQFSIGEGSEQDMLVGGDGVGAAAAIALDVAESFKTQTSQDVLASFSTAAIVALASPTVQWTIGKLASVEPSLDVFPLGSLPRLMFSDDAWEADNFVDLRLVSISGDMSEKLSLDVQSWVA